MRIPTIHLNGSSKDHLIETLTNATHAIGKAIKAVAETDPNGRDYYPQGPDAFTAARAEHHARMIKLDAIQRELFAIVEAIEDGRPA